MAAVSDCIFEVTKLSTNLNILVLLKTGITGKWKNVKSREGNLMKCQKGKVKKKDRTPR